MKVLYIHQYFCTPTEPGGTRSYWISKELLNRGHCVTVLTAANNNHKPGRENIDGIDVVYIKTPRYDNYMSPIKKVWSFIAFIFNAYKTAVKECNVDIVYATSTPLTIGIIALLLNKRKKLPYVFEVRDLWPEFPIQIGVIKNKFLISILRKLEKRIYDKAVHIVTLSPGMREGVEAVGVSHKKISMIPNMSKPDLFFPHELDWSIVKQFGIDINKFNVIHFGSMGRANGLEYIIEAAKYLKSKNCYDVNFIFMGSGATEPILKQKVDEYRLSNIQFLGSHNMKTVIEVVNCCDASITTFINLPVLKTNSPNKLFDSLSAGKPIIVNSAGWTKDMVEHENCGFYVDVEKPEMLANKLLEYKDQINLLTEWGNNARRLSIEVYDKAKLSAQVADVLETTFSKLKK